MYLARALTQQSQLDDAVKEIKQTLGPDVVSLRYKIERDWSGDWAIFFLIVLSDDASRRDRLRNSTSRIKSAINERLQPLEQWGVLPYFDYRSQSEQDALKEEAWA